MCRSSYLLPAFNSSLSLNHVTSTADFEVLQTNVAMHSTWSNHSRSRRVKFKETLIGSSGSRGCWVHRMWSHKQEVMSSICQLKFKNTDSVVDMLISLPMLGLMNNFFQILCTRVIPNALFCLVCVTRTSGLDVSTEYTVYCASIPSIISFMQSAFIPSNLLITLAVLASCNLLSFHPTFWSLWLFHTFTSAWYMYDMMSNTDGLGNCLL